MKKFLKIVLLFFLLFQVVFLHAQVFNGTVPPVRNCGTVSPDVSWAKWFSQQVNSFKNQQALKKGAVTNYTIPVIVHVLNSGSAIGVNENISLAQIQSQIDILNQDYSGTNADISSVPSEFLGVESGNTGIQFCLAKQDTNGVALQEYGVDRINWQARGWSDPNLYPGTNDRYDLKLYFTDTVKPNTIWNPKKYLNVWIAQIDNSGLLGYANFPVGTGYNDLTGFLETATTSGVVINHKAWGNIGTALGWKYNKGRTATHEIGHWLGLYHTFQDYCSGTDTSNCSSSGDYCCDTPPTSSSNFGCPVTKNTCIESPVDHNDMTMNFMDYTDDACMYLFTADQAIRMQTAMANGTFRSQLKNSTACEELKPDISIISTQVTPTSVTAGNSVTVNFIEKNNAVGNANANYVNFYLSSDSILTPGLNRDTLLTQYFINQTIFALSQTPLLTKQVTIPVGLTTGTYYLFLVADGTGVISETNESNNLVRVAVNVDFACLPGLLPTIATSSTTSPLCINAASQTTTLAYSAVTNSPVYYNISWNATPVNSFVAVSNAALPASPINITVPANTAIGTYTGTITVKNENGCYSAGTNFTVAVSALPTITVSSTAGRCFSTNPQTTTLPYTAVTGIPVSYSISWNSVPSNNFVSVTDSILPASPITINIPANTLPGTYSGTITVKNATGCVSTGFGFTLTINPLPSISVSSSATGVCTGTTAQTTSLSYSAVTNSPATYSIIWSSSPSNSFTPVTNAALPASPINITVPANTAAGTYTGTITVKNANSCISNGTDFTLVVTNSLSTSITASSVADSVCFSTISQASSLQYSDVTGSPVTYNITWNTSPANSFTPVIDSVLPVSPIGIKVPASTSAGTYTGSIKVKNALGCYSSGNSFTLTVNPLPTITLSAVAAKCFSTNSQTTTLSYSSVTGSPVSYSINWNSSPANNFLPISDSAFPASPVTINIPANTPAGTYTGTITIKNAKGCISTGYNFTVKINALPTISTSQSAAGVCLGTTAQVTTLSYSAVTDLPTNYSIVWSSTPANSFATVTNAVLPSSPININVPANTAAGTYTGTITVKNANGCISTGNSFSVIVTNNQSTTITTASSAGNICFSADSQATTLAYTSVSGYPVTYGITWNTSPANNFLPVTDSVLPASPISISIPAATAAGTYTGTVKVKNAFGCTSSGSNFTVTVNPLPTITTSYATLSKCFNSGAQVTTLAYSAPTGSPATYSIAWNTSPANSFVPVTDATLSSSPISISIPAGTLDGIYTATIKVKNANGCISTGNTFADTIKPLPTITASATAVPVCYSTLSQNAVLPYSASTSSPVLYYVLWNSSPPNSFVNVTAASLPASPISLVVPANTLPATYMATLRVKNAAGCVSSGNNFTLSVSSNPSLGADTSALIICSNDVADISKMYNTAGLTQLWNLTDSSKATIGTHQLVVTNSFGCKDTANITVKQDIKQWLGNTDSSWHTASNWSTGKVPNDSTHVIIAGNTAFPCDIIAADAAAASLQILNGGTYIVSEGKKLAINGKCSPANLPLLRLPVLVTVSPSNITQASVTTGGNISDNGGSGIIARGVCISMNSNPAITDAHTSDGTGIGSFVSQFTGLSANTTYHIRSYATNVAGTGYGNDIIFTTSP